MEIWKELNLRKPKGPLLFTAGVFFASRMCYIEKKRNEVRPVRIRIVGAGALGLLYTHQIMATSAQIELFTHSQKQSDLLNLQGLKYINNNTETLMPINASSIHSYEYITKRSEPVDWIFLMVKQKDITESLLNQLIQLSTPETRVLCFQNGIGHMELLHEVFPANRLYAAITTEGAIKLSEHSVQHTGQGTTWVGSMDETAYDSSEFGEPEIMLQSMLLEAGFEVYLSKKIISRIWNKLLINAVVNPLTAIFQINNGALLKAFYLQDIMKALLEEGCLVAKYARIEIADDLWEQLLQVCERTAENQSSMMKDIAEGRSTEIDWINGALLQCADKFDLVLPTHQTLYRMVKHLESR
jgi:2-dehydropantoate 2-reductase